MQVEAHRDLILWAVRKYKELQPKASGGQAMESEDVGEAMHGESSSGADGKSMADIEKAEKEDRARLAAERRVQIMAQMANAQKSFMTTNAELFESAAIASAQEKNESAMEWQENASENDSQAVCLGRNRKYRFVEDPVVTCILCSEDAVVNASGPCMVYSAFVQKSKVLAHQNDLAPSPHTSTCGHVMHATCWKEYFNNEVMKENRRPNRNRAQGNFATDKKEFLCPLCRCLSNAVLPISPALSRVGAQHPLQYAVTTDDSSTSISQPTETSHVEEFDKWLASMRKYNDVLQKITDLPELSKATPDILDKFMNLDTINPDILAQSVKRDILSSNLRDYVIEFTKCAELAAPYPFVDELTEPHFVTWMSCAYTIETLEMYLRALNKPLKGQMSIRQTSCLSGLIRVSGLLVTTIDDLTAAKILIHLRSQLSIIFTNSASCFIDWDLFKVFVLFMFTTPAVLLAKIQQCIIPNGTLLEYYLLQMIYAVMVTKIIVLHKYDDENYAGGAPDDAMAGSEGQAMETSFIEPIDSSKPSKHQLVDFYLKYNIQVKDARDAGTELPMVNKSVFEIHQTLMEAIRTESRVFLRSASLLFHFLTDIDMPDELYDADGDTFETMCNYLGISSQIDAYLECDNIRSFMENLASHPEIDELRTTKRKTLETVLVPCTPKVRRLIELPVDYSDLINAVSTFTCPNNERDESSRNPTMCLVCGTTMCSMAYCCQREYENTTVGSCTYHAQVCGAGVGIFLRIRECEILLLGVNKGCFVSPPYLDKYGETDQGLRRGNPLTLCPERYQKLNLLWLNHSLHEDIARSAEAINNVIPTQWIHL